VARQRPPRCGAVVSLLARGGPVGKHRRTSHRSPRRRRHVAMVDARTLTEHRLTDAAFAAGRRPKGSYISLFGTTVLPAALTVGERDYCRGCATVAR
jgi:hypothetical protein